jgi:hypothetical protein
MPISGKALEIEAVLTSVPNRLNVKALIIVNPFQAKTATFELYKILITKRSR